MIPRWVKWLGSEILKAPQIDDYKIPKVWEHAEVGRFEYRGLGWHRWVSFPAFKMYSYDSGRLNSRPNNGQYSLAIGARNDTTPPSLGAIHLVNELLENHMVLAEFMRDALWDDINGTGPPSGNWWYGNLTKVREYFECDRLPPPMISNDLLPALQLESVLIDDSGVVYAKPLAEFCFRASFELEHGLSILTDGRAVCGIGYSLEVEPFDAAFRAFKITKRGTTK